MLVRHLGHDGLYHYFTGTTPGGALLWTTDANKAYAFATESAAQRIAQIAEREGLDVELTL